MNGNRKWWWSALGIIQVVLTIAVLAMGLVVLKNNADESQRQTMLNRDVIEKVQELTRDHSLETQAQNCALMQLGAGLANRAGIPTTPEVQALIEEACR